MATSSPGAASSPPFPGQGVAEGEAEIKIRPRDLHVDYNDRYVIAVHFSVADLSRLTLKKELMIVRGTLTSMGRPLSM